MESYINNSYDSAITDLWLAFFGQTVNVIDKSNNRWWKFLTISDFQNAFLQVQKKNYLKMADNCT